MSQRDIQSTPEWREADEFARTMFERAFPEKTWRGRRTNRAYWRRLAKGEIKRAEGVKP